MSCFVQQVAGPGELGRVYSKNSGLGEDAGEEGGLLDFTDLHRQANLGEEGRNCGKSSVGQVHKVAWFDGSSALETSR